MITAAAVQPANPMVVRDQFTGIAVDLARLDEKLQYHGDRGNRPTGDWNGELLGLATRLDEARMQFADVRPDAREIVYSLGADVRDISEAAGKLAIMVSNNLSFRGGWGSVLDQSIDDAQRAASLISEVPGPPTPPVTPPFPGGGSAVSSDAARAAALVRQSIAKIQTVPSTDRGDASTKDARIAAFNLNMEAQKVLEQHFGGSDSAVTSQLRTADAHLEDANWQLAKKPSPDGRFNGVDQPGALRDSQAAVAILEQLATQPAA